MSLSSVIFLARGELGTCEEPSGSNLTKYGFWYGVNGVPWCVIFLCWLFDHAGERMAFFGGGKTASCSILLRWYKEQGLTVPVEQVQAGDIVILNFHGKTEPEHCGLVVVETMAPYDNIRTIEGNTSPGLEGSQGNGGCVALRTRYLSQIVAVCRPQYKAEGDLSAPSGGTSPEGEAKDDITGHWAEDNIRWCMEHGLMTGYPDGSFQPDKPVTRAELATVIRRLADK